MKRQSVLAAFILFYVGDMVPVAHSKQDFLTPAASQAYFEPLGLQIRVMSANIGNNTGEEDATYVAWRMESASYEQYLARRIQSIRPDVIGFQEVLSQNACDGITNADARHTCFYNKNSHAVRRLVGQDYSIICDNRTQWECLAVHVDFARIDGVKKGGINIRGAETPGLPEKPCTYGVNCDETLCDEDSSVSAVTLYIENDEQEVPLRLIHAHPNAGDFQEFYVGSLCRREQVGQIFIGSADSAPLMKAEMRNLVIGDFNYDPSIRFSTLDPMFSEHRQWDSFVAGMKEETGEGPRRFSIHSAKTPEGKLQTTIAGLLTFDHVLSDFATGKCDVMGGGALVGLDEGFQFDSYSEKSRLDHSTVLCDLSI
ncbi:MAG: hypothetical protein H6618_03745 [Deltaproteobacteria bacterium]|nr:hypothetical protein [Deltaproteobacteria bacterium]